MIKGDLSVTCLFFITIYLVSIAKLQSEVFNVICVPFLCSSADTSSCSEGEGQVDDEEEGGPGEGEDGGGGEGGTLSSQEGSISMERWICRAVHGTSSTTTTTSSTASSSSSSTHSGGSGAAGSKTADARAQHVQFASHRLLHHHNHHHRHKPG